MRNRIWLAFALAVTPVLTGGAVFLESLQQGVRELHVSATSVVETLGTDSPEELGRMVRRLPAFR